ncbi:MAG TPA: DUF4394 domain-containing protein [Ferruginibacter sp.]|nr:DUF4394 domain-containing protein [Ferruginibacter sp.]HMP22142.1 DUF4394 domain-containing protein [Ferruginibacter sp.]
MAKATFNMGHGIFMTLIALFAINLSSCKKESANRPDMPVAKPDIEFYTINASGDLAKYNAKSTTSPIASVAVSGLQPGENILGIDFRPATGELYGLGSTSRLYVINLSTGAAREIGAGQFTPVLNGNIVGFDFNPTVDRIRIVTSTGQNLRLHPETGAIVATDGNINGPASPMVTAVAYSGNKAGATFTTLFDIDINNKKLYKQIPPNDGGLVEVGNLGVTATGEGGFDISPDGAVALAALVVDGKSSLFSIDTATGKASRLSDFGGSSMIKGLAIPTEPVAYAVDESNNLLIFNPMTPATPVMKPITGIAIGDKITGIDFRPLNGQLYAIGSGGNLYTLNTASGAAAMVGPGAFTTLFGSYAGFDFNPTVDRIRLITNTGQNLRLHPTTGLLVAVDGALNPGTPNVTAAAYTNNFAGATTTTLFDIDCATNKLYKQIPPNDGTLVEVGALGINPQSDNGFDIGSTSGIAYALLTVSDKTAIYTINLETGAATKMADFPVKTRGFALGLGF